MNLLTGGKNRSVPLVYMRVEAVSIIGRTGRRAKN